MVSKLKVTHTNIMDLCIIEPNIYEDKRGYFMESFNTRDWQDAGFRDTFVQDNESTSKKGVLRGLHYQYKNPQAKLVRVLEGEIHDVAVDLRVGSVTFGQYYDILLSDSNKKQFYIPIGFAHGFLVLSDTAKVLYKTTAYYQEEYDCGIRWNDPYIHIAWPLNQIDEVILSEKDKKLPYLEDILEGRLFIE